MSITEGALRRDRLTAIVVAVLLVSGVSAYFSMPQQMDPGFVIRVAQIVTFFPGASPDRVETLVTDPIEQAAQSLPELDFVGSTSRAGVSIVSVSVREEFSDVRPIWDSLRRKIDAAAPSLPSGIIGPQINDELGDTFPMIFTLSADGFSDREVKDIAKTIRDQLLHLDGVAKVQILGEQEERIFVEFNDARLSRLGLSPTDIQRTLQGRNIIIPGGEVDVGPDTLVLEPSGNFGSVEELGRTILKLPTGGFVYLEDVTTVRRGYVDPPQGLVTQDGNSAVAFAVSMAAGNNLVELGQRVKTFFDDLVRYYPHGIEFELAYFQPTNVEAKVSEFLDNVVQAVLIVLVVMLFTLGLRTGLIVSTLIPVAMVVTVWVLDLLGESINQMSLAALIIALGLLVDNAIVVSESILVRMESGENPFDAATAACRELQVPLLVSSLTTCAAFLPIYLAESAVGEYTGALFVVVSITLLVSWLLALTMTPLLCTKFLKPKPQSAESYDGRFYRMYRRGLRAVLRNRIIAVVFAVVLFVGSLPLWGLVPSIFFPAEDSPMFVAAFNLPPGTSMKTTQEMTKKIDAFLQADLVDEGVENWTTFIGETPPPFTLGFTPSPSQGGYAELMVHVQSAEQAPAIMDRLGRFALDAFPDVSTNIRMLSAGPPVDRPVQVRISGTDMEDVFAIVDKIQTKIRETPGTKNIVDDWGARAKKLTVSIDSDRARRSGVTHQEVATSMQTFLSGMETTRYRERDESIPVILRSLAEERRSLERIQTLSVFSSGAEGPLPLSQVANISLAFEPASIIRRDRYRTVTISAGVQEGTTASEVFAQLKPWLEQEQKSWPLGYRWEFGGEFESSQKANASIGEKLPIAGLVILLLLIWQFNSLRKTAIILSSIVLAMIGVVLGLVAFRSSFGFMTLLGVISLAGIVINNAIVLLDRIRIEIEDMGRPPVEAVVSAAQQRLRPILLTTLTTVASLIPLYLTGGAMWQPMAVAIMAGLVFSTMLTLVFVPVLYSMFFGVERPA